MEILKGIIGFAFGLLLLWAFTLPHAAAEDIQALHAVDGLGNTVTITGLPCADPRLLQIIPPEIAANFGRGLTIYSGVTYSNCWAVTADGEILIIDTGRTDKPEIYLAQLKLSAP